MLGRNEKRNQLSYQRPSRPGNNLVIFGFCRGVKHITCDIYWHIALATNLLYFLSQSHKFPHIYIKKNHQNKVKWLEVHNNYQEL